MIFNVVVLPHPDGPRIETNSLALKEREIPLSAWTFVSATEYSFVIFCNLYIVLVLLNSNKIYNTKLGKSIVLRKEKINLFIFYIRTFYKRKMVIVKEQRIMYFSLEVYIVLHIRISKTNLIKKTHVILL